MENKKNAETLGNEYKTDNYFDKIKRFFSYLTIGSVQDKELPQIENNQNKINETQRDSVKQVVYNLKLNRKSIQHVPMRFSLDTSINSKKDSNTITDISKMDFEQSSDKQYKEETLPLDVSDKEDKKENGDNNISNFHMNEGELFLLDQETKSNKTELKRDRHEEKKESKKEETKKAEKNKRNTKERNKTNREPKMVRKKKEKNEQTEEVLKQKRENKENRKKSEEGIRELIQLKVEEEEETKEQLMLKQMRQLKKL